MHDTPMPVATMRPVLPVALVASVCSPVGGAVRQTKINDDLCPADRLTVSGASVDAEVVPQGHPRAWDDWDDRP